MARWFANNVGLMILALILAFFVWAVASLQQDPILERTISAPVVVTGQPSPDETILSSTLPATITARIRAPQSVMNVLPANGVHVDVDLSQLGVGEHVIPLQPAINASPATLISSRPTTATVTIEQLAQARFPLRVSLVGTPAVGYRALSPSVEPKEAVISATQQVISQVASVDAIVTVENVRSSVEQTVRLVARDSDGNIVGNVGISPDAALVRVPMEQLSNYRDLAVRVKLQGQPANGYAVTNIAYAPQVVTVFGPREAIQRLPGFIETLDVLVDGATQDVEERVGLNVPPGVSLVSENLSVLVNVRVEPQQGARTVTRAPILNGVSGTLTGTVAPPTIDIVLAGSLPRLNSLTEDDVRVIVDVTGLEAGVHQVTPTIVVPEGLTVQTVLPATIQVDLRDIGERPTSASPRAFAV
jgi:YbbR domain-containing protein